MECFYILSEIWCASSFITSRIREMGQVFSVAFLAFHASVKCPVPFFQVYSVILSVFCTVLLLTFERPEGFLNSITFTLFSYSIFMFHITFLCMAVTICYRTSYMAQSVADINFSAPSIYLNYLLLTSVVWPARSFTAYLWLHLLNGQSNWAWRIFNRYSVLLIAREKFIPPSKGRLLRQCNLCFHSYSACSRSKSCHTAPFPIYRHAEIGWDFQVRNFSSPKNRICTQKQTKRMHAEDEKRIRSTPLKETNKCFYNNSEKLTGVWTCSH